MYQSINYKENDIAKGIVTSIKKYGAFLSFEGGYIGLLHISEISTNFVNSINTFFKVGDVITVLIKSVDKNTKFLKLSIKDLPTDLNEFKEILPSKKVTTYIKDIDFSKLEKILPKMIQDELEREKQYGIWFEIWLYKRGQKI